ncbi:COP9 signalosome catalytic subunit rri1 [Maudiozyma exigua]|uniref:COP9 signalosome complex subunit 5 n=1 Tax=Maudiozyma exigua TaxID=34358 RepID=A0A9P6W7U9_MAUEX|nr:COP9 signalosome catalytic subunit rri1 [Kazachstania exigua]
MFPCYETVASLRSQLRAGYKEDGTYDQNHSFPMNKKTGLTQRQIIQRCMSSTPTLNNMKNPKYFNEVYISKLCCQQILKHAVSGGDNEIMGMLIGVTHGSRFIVTESFPLPVLGTETRVNAMSESYEYMVQYMNSMTSSDDKINRIVGWYHSHPGYDCWLSKIDMTTQQLNQSYQDPYLAIVIDPKKSIEQAAIRIGAFRTVTDGVESNGNVSFYELPMVLFESELDVGIGTNKLNYKLEQSNVNYEFQLFDNLFDSMKQINNFNEVLVQEEESADGEIENELKRGSVPTQKNLEGLSSNRIRGHLTQSRTSTPSIDNESDIDMIHDIYSEKETEVESVTSSLGTAPENSFTMLRSHFNTNTGTVHESSPNNLMQSRRISQGQHIQGIDGSLSGIQASTDALIADKQAKFHSIDDSTLILQRNSLRAAYNKNKRELLRFKVQEYKNYRFYRDTFTL